MMMKALLFATATLLTLHTRAQVIPNSAATKEAFVPKGWKIFKQAEGDLNKDSLADAALIIQNTDKSNLKKNEGLGAATLDLNPRILLVLLKDKKGSYTLASKNTTFIPTAGSEENPCLSDPLSETEGVAIKKGLLYLHFQYWLSCGSYSTSNDDYVFRYQNKRFELIGYESNEMSRSTGEMSTYSVNFSTRKASSKTGDNMFEDPKEKPVTKTKSFSLATLPDLNKITELAFGEILNKINK